MRLILAPEEQLRAAPVRKAAVVSERPSRRAGDRLPGDHSAFDAAPMPRLESALFINRRGYAARQLRRAFADYLARSEQPA